jgi:hypothetical protein
METLNVSYFQDEARIRDFPNMKECLPLHCDVRLMFLAVLSFVSSSEWLMMNW